MGVGTKARQAWRFYSVIAASMLVGFALGFTPIHD